MRNERFGQQQSESDMAALDIWLEFVGRGLGDDDSAFEELCGQRIDIASALRSLRATWQREGMSSPQVAAPSFRERLQSLANPRPRGTRFLRESEIARGGMGVVHRVRDPELDRSLALKEMIAGPAELHPAAASRFLEEVQIMAQLDHPGIVPVHEVGMDAGGRIYFAMKLVRGRDLRRTLDLLHEGDEGWKQTRALGVLLKVCEAMAYAHSKGVIHRDLKPGNVMVGNFGEVYVMDWGLARALGREELHDIRIRQAPESLSVQTSRRSERNEAPDSPLVTMDGDVVGTPSYMSPEQARGDVHLLSPRSDVYSVGAMLYHLLTGQAPFVPRNARISNHTVLARLIDGPPQDVHLLNPEAPAELVAVCEKAMARDLRERYSDMGDLAADLSAFIERRVVKAYEAGAWAEARKWVRRNKPLAATLAAAAVLALSSLSAITYVHARGRKIAERESERADAKAHEAEQNLALSQEHQRRAETETAKVLRLADVKVLQELKAEADKLWPAYPDRVPDMESWLARARGLADNLAVHRATLSEMRARALSSSDEDRAQDRTAHPRTPELSASPGDPSALAGLVEDGLGRSDLEAAEGPRAEPESQVASLAVKAEARRTWRFASPEDQWQHDVLAQLIEDLEGLQSGLLSENAIMADQGWSVPKRLAFAQRLASGFGADGDYARSWSDASREIEATYPGLGLTPQLGLVPIGQDPWSGLWEFAHLQTGEPAVRGPDGKLVLNDATGLVFVLLPGGAFLMGAQKSDPNGANYDPQAQANEGPVHDVVLSPYFISKYEMTQGQWQRAAGRNPSHYQTENGMPLLLHPVEQVSWFSCREICNRLGLSLPSEAQWEYAARGWTSSPWWTGNDRESLTGAVNLADRAAARKGANWAGITDWPELEDGFAGHAPVNLNAPNPFGLHNVHGNVWETCLDGYDPDFYEKSPSKEPVADAKQFPSCLQRGGCFMNMAAAARSAARGRGTLEGVSHTIGLRPARAITP